MIEFPFLSEYDPETKSEGSLDPLGTYSIADKLATVLVPGFRERMRRPRFLTAMAVGTVVCNQFDEELIAADDIIPPWQVYEWYVVQALVKTFRGKPDIIGLPGSDKASNAMNHDLKLNASRYLKSPSVFGFHGVYRTLARALDVTYNDQLGEHGDRLVRAWEKDQKLAGFLSPEGEEGKSFKSLLYYAVKEGIDIGEVKRSWGWNFFNTIAEHLVPSKIGNQEGKVLFDLIVSDHKGFRGIVILKLMEFLKSDSYHGNFGESAFYHDLFKDSSGDIKPLLKSILAYETFSRIITNAFEEILFHMSDFKKQTDISEMSELRSIRYATKNIANQYKLTIDSFSETKGKIAFQQTFDIFEQVRSASDFVELLIQHHRNIQKNKPPNGKMDWLVQTNMGKWIISPNYVRKKSLVMPDDSFVHYYRTSSLLTFLKDLKKI